MPSLTPEQEAKVREMETEEERAKREAEEARADLDKPRRGRPPGTPNKPRFTEESLLAGCETLVRLCWYLCYPVGLLFGGKLADLTPEDITEGAREARNFVLRFPLLITLLTVIGFPAWLLRTAISKFRRADKPQLQVVNDASKQPERRA